MNKPPVNKPRAVVSQQPVVTPAPPAVAPTPPPKADDDARLQRIEDALRRGGLLAVEPGAAQRASELEVELGKLEQQQKTLEAAIAGGVDLEGVRAALAQVKTQVAQIRAELAAQRGDPSDDTSAPKPPLLVRLDAIEAALARIEQRLSNNAAAVPEAAPPQKTPERVAAPAPPAAGNDFREGFVLRSADGNYSVQPNGFVQARLEGAWPEHGDHTLAFSLPRARAGVKGTLFDKNFKYNFLADFGKGTTQLSYFYGDCTFVKDYLGLRFGLFKRQYSRAQTTASERLELVTSPLTMKASGDSHDIGVMIHNGTPDFEYSVGLFNGTGSKGNFKGTVMVDPTTGAGTVTQGDFSNVPDRFHPTLVTRAAYNYRNINGYSEADLEGGPLRFSIGVAGVGDFDHDGDHQSYVRGTLDAVLKAEGFSAIGALFANSRQSGTSFGKRSHDWTGALVQTGYVIAQQFQPAARYTLIVPPGSAVNTHEFALGMNVYFHGHALKWQNEFDFRSTDAGGKATTVIGAMTQAQLIF